MIITVSIFSIIRGFGVLGAAKDFFRKAKACKPSTKQVLDQIKEIEKYISRMPG